MAQQIQLYELYDFWYEPFWHMMWFKLLCAFLLITVVVLCVRWLRTRRHRAAQPPWQIAFDALVSLDSLADSRRFYFRLTEILKEYLRELSSDQFASKSDYEVVAALTSLNLDDQTHATITTIFEHATRSKFARAAVDQEIRQRDLEQVLVLIAKTKGRFSASQKG